MIKRTSIVIGVLLAGIVVVSLVNPFMVYHIDRYNAVQFGKYYEYSGVLDVRSTYSDGTASYDRIGRICDSLNLHFAIIVDKNTVRPFKDGMAKRWGMTLMIPAVELDSPGAQDRFIVAGDSTPLLPESGVSTDSALRFASERGSLIILGEKSESEIGSGLPGYSSPKINAIEIYNFNNSLIGKLTLFGINKLFGAYIGYSADESSLNYLIQFPAERLKEFDAISQTRKVTALAGLGARSNFSLAPKNNVRFPSYEGVFNLLHTVIVTRVPYNALYHHDCQLTVSALKNGNSFVAFSGLEPARGFLFTASSGGMQAIMGDSLQLRGNAELEIDLPDSDNVETELVKDGRIIRSFTDSGTISLSVTEPGVYRVQVFQKRAVLPFFLIRSYPWILSNPIRIYEK